VSGSVDSSAKRAIETRFPDHPVPDEENFVLKDRQHKPPDHAIFWQELCVERKSINPNYRGMPTLPSAQAGGIYWNHNESNRFGGKGMSC